jgi:predicted HNH restriction endonuclease
MQLVAYALAKCGNPAPGGQSGGPPAWLRVKTWKEAYALFYDALGDGRTEKSFANSLKNARDAFDAHVSSSRVGWVDRTSAAHREDVMVGRILSQWGNRSDEDLRSAAKAILAGATADQGDEEEEAVRRTEGGVKVYTAKRYERVAKYRDEAIAHHGTSCMACNFDFAASYGALGRGYIEVHHAMPLADHGQRKTDPKSDLIVLCANCHRMVHRRRDVCLTLGELRSKLGAGSAA